MKLLLFLIILVALPIDCRMRRMGKRGTKSNFVFNPNPAAARSGQKIMKMFGSAVGNIMEQKQEEGGIKVRQIVVGMFILGLILLGAYSVIKALKGLQSKHDTFVPCKHVKIEDDAKFFLQHGFFPDQIGNKRKNKLKNM